MKKKLWILGFFILVIAAFFAAGSTVVRIDPYFHYHKPDTEHYYYSLYNQRSQNNGIIRNFDYDGIIIGTSMAENFKTTEAEQLFGGSFIKVCFSGGSFYEICTNLETAAAENDSLKIVIRSLDMGKFFDDKDLLREDLGAYPSYLYDDIVLNDFQYILNRDILFTRVYPMIRENDKPDFRGGITSFDTYSNWMKNYRFGHQTVLPKGISVKDPPASAALTQEESESVRANVIQNVTDLARQYPDITFYCYLPPYSAVWWYDVRRAGDLEKQIEAERIVIEEVLRCENIKLFSLNCRFDITTDLNNYKDRLHYGEWVNSLLLRCMHDGENQLTADNYEQYLQEEYSFYSGFDYSTLDDQADYERDYYAAALMEAEITGTKPCVIDLTREETFELSGAAVEEDLFHGEPGVVCTGCLQREVKAEISKGDYIRDVGYVGIKIHVDDIGPYRYLVFYGKKIADHGQLTARVFDADGDSVAALDKKYSDLDNQWHQYLIDVSKLTGPVTIILNGGYIDVSGSASSRYAFSGIALY